MKHKHTGSCCGGSGKQPRTNRGGLPPREKALAMLDAAINEPVPAKRRKLAQTALALYPHLPGGWIIMAVDAATVKEALACVKRAVSAGEQDLGADFFQKHTGRFWEMVETRPYMRAKLFLADFLWKAGREDEAIAHYRDCLRLNPGDHQGVRHILSTCLLIKNGLDEAARLLDGCKAGRGAEFVYNKALLLFKKHGPESKAAVKQIKSALQGNLYVPQYLRGKSKLPSHLPDCSAPGSKTEAAVYAAGALRAWQETPGALAWLAQFQSPQNTPLSH